MPLFARPTVSLLASSALLVCSAQARADTPSIATLKAGMQKTYKAFKAKYRAIKLQRHAVVKFRHPSSGKLLETREVTQEVTMPADGGKPSVKILSCKKDGKVASASECKPKKKSKREPFYQVTDPDAEKHYTFSVIGTRRISGVDGIEIKITPKKNTSRHMRGKVVVAKDDYRLLMVEGRPADLPFGVKSLYIKLLFAKHGKLASVSQSGYMDVWVRIPLVMKKRITTSFRDSKHVLIPR
jgi:hypothetical protein